MNTTTLFPSNLIISTSPETFLQNQLFQLGHTSTANNPDVFLIDQSTGWGIDQIRQIRLFLSRRPLLHQSKVVIIHQTQNLNTESQNALLKTLEEPGPNNYLFLTASSTSSLLPTIVSRCQTILIDTHPPKTDLPPLTVSSDLKKNLSSSFELAKKYNKDTILDFFNQQIASAHARLCRQPSPHQSTLVAKLIKARQMILANVDHQSALDFFFLS